jgi:uncharacterized membrane protein
MKKILRFFVQGLIVFIPLTITVFVLFKLFEFFGSMFSVLGFTQNYFLNTALGLLVTIVFIVVLGLLASSYVFREFFSFIEDKLEHAPFIRHIYSPVKDFTNAFMGNKKKFNKPVLVLTNPLVNIQEIGFITHEDLTQLGILDKVAVYLPASYSLSGKLILVPKEHITPMKWDGAEAMKFVVSGGITDVD